TGASTDRTAQSPGGLPAERCLTSDSRLYLHLRLGGQWGRSPRDQRTDNTGMAQRGLARLSRRAARYGRAVSARSPHVDRFRLADVRRTPHDRRVDTASRGCGLDRFDVAVAARAPVALSRRIPHAFGARD